MNVSAFFYQNLEPVLDAASKVVPNEAGKELQGGMNPLKNLFIGQGPTLIYAYAEEDRILFASTNQSPLGLNLQTLAGFGGILGHMDHAHDAAEQHENEMEEAR